jgi:hypothetical protein
MPPENKSSELLEKDVGVVEGRREGLTARIYRQASAMKVCRFCSKI